jgi:hypothetical protein
LKKERTLPDTTNLVQRIQSSFDVLCSQKTKFEDKLDIRKYGFEIYKTILIIDREAKDPWIRVDEYVLDIWIFILVQDELEKVQKEELKSSMSLC